ncbi:hypothetical protein CUS75_08365 [Enterococcus faecalis]|uniref:hypothetical protein n=1 Tax=Enterococcus faecalis TaxID=1351 RepID=UPI000CF2268A|nr:hypothetical protein [Enterococcus faecalis]EIB6801376.1 hypothetical protein [Enterococcus faecalis]PQE87492.1 hypothetical protein CUS08_06835 [Enterococcus faecalis]PQF41589.1 hypothetical protein CUS75_08365 [Enterococcus faecalis]
MSKKAVWLSDIEFIEMHSSDWERLESEAFEPDESVQAQLNENQQVVLDWLKNDMLDDSDFYNTIYNSRFLHVNGEPHRKENIAFMKLKNKELAQVIQAFSQWALEQEETE